jgi:MoaA/NifB/PqqE/SkfB family radical SAM enzyme
LPATPAPPFGTISWNMNTSCNYRCSYCTQRFLDDRGRWAEDVPRFLAAFAQLPGAWEIKLSGGEPFVHPRFLELVEGLAALSFRISVVTNFSASREKLLAFLAAAGARLGVVSCSFHPEYVSDGPARADFIARCRLVQDRLPAGASLNVTCVATHAQLPHLPALRDEFSAAGITFKVQPEKQNRDVIVYSDGERAQLLALGGHNATGEIAPDYFGRPCWAGARYLIVDDLGNAYRCYPARRYRKESLGNLLDGSFALRDGPRPCPYHYCNCTVPIERGMMPRGPQPELTSP